MVWNGVNRAAVGKHHLDLYSIPFSFQNFFPVKGEQVRFLFTCSFIGGASPQTLDREKVLNTIHLVRMMRSDSAEPKAVVLELLFLTQRPGGGRGLAEWKTR